MTLIPDVANCWRFWSVRLAAVVVVFGLLPQDLQEGIVAFIAAWAGVPAEWQPALLGAIAIVSRLLAQPDLAEPVSQEPAE